MNLVKCAIVILNKVVPYVYPTKLLIELKSALIVLHLVKHATFFHKPAHPAIIIHISMEPFVLINVLTTITKTVLITLVNLAIPLA